LPRASYQEDFEWKCENWKLRSQNHARRLWRLGPWWRRLGIRLGTAGRRRFHRRDSPRAGIGRHWIDTAAAYGLGHSEEVVARALKEWRGTRPYVFTKCILRWNEKGKVYKEFSAESVRRECQDSLRRLQIETFDLYQMHWPQTKTSLASKKPGKLLPH